MRKERVGIIPIDGPQAQEGFSIRMEVRKMVPRW